MVNALSAHELLAEFERLEVKIWLDPESPTLLYAEGPEEIVDWFATIIQARRAELVDALLNRMVTG